MAGTSFAETTRYVLATSDGHRAGEQVVERLEDGVTKVRSLFKDSGGDPKRRSHPDRP